MLHDFRLLHLVILNIGIKADRLFPDSSLYDFIQTVKGAATDKQHIGGIKLDKFLMRMFPAALRRNISHGTFQDFQQCLLYTFTADITCDGRIF